MSSQHVQSPPLALRRAHTSAGSPLAAVLERLARVGRALWNSLDARGRSHADREMLDQADRWQHSHPKLARELRSYVRGATTY